MKSLSWVTIESVYNQYHQWYTENNLKDCGLKLFSKPNVTEQKVSQSTFAFLLLWLNVGEVISKEQMTDNYRKLFPKYFNDFQSGRHIGNNSGYNVKNYHHGIKGYMLYDLKITPKINHNSEQMLTEKEWLSLKNEYDKKCACCGSKEGNPMSRANGITKLEKGHMNPDEILSYNNTIPQCQYCNGASKSKRMFNKKGETIAIKNKDNGEWVRC